VEGTLCGRAAAIPDGTRTEENSGGKPYLSWEGLPSVTAYIADIQKYIEERWGASILEVESATTTVKLPRSNVLDEQVFDLILDQNEREQWEKAIDCDHEAIRHIQRDYNLIWHIGTASDRGVRHEMEIRDWQSKTRGELFIAELADEGERTLLRSHVQFMLPAAGVEHAYPYLQLSPIVDDDTDEWFSDEDDEEYTPELELGDGSRVSGIDCSGEYFEYTVSVKLNELGTTLLGLSEILCN
jgi:hypothetical protein